MKKKIFCIKWWFTKGIIELEAEVNEETGVASARSSTTGFTDYFVPSEWRFSRFDALSTVLLLMQRKEKSLRRQQEKLERLRKKVSEDLEALKSEGELAHESEQAGE